MSYIDGFVAAVETARREEYRAFAEKAWPFFRDLGCLSQHECWGDDVPVGKQTDFRRAVAAREGEQVVFSWLVWPDKATRDAGMKRMEREGEAMGEMPFDGSRMIFGGFTPIFVGEAK